MLSIIDVKRSRCSILHSNQMQAERKRPVRRCHVILGTPTFMHHLGSTLSLMCYMKRDYKGKSEPNISHWQKYSAHTKVYIFQLKNNYSSSEPFVCACFVVLTKRGGPFITMNGGRRCEFSLYCTSAYSATVSVAGSLALKRWWFVVCDLWFFELGKQTCPAWVNISLWELVLYNTELVKQVSSPASHFTSATLTIILCKCEGGSNAVVPNLVVRTPTRGVGKCLLGEKSRKTMFLLHKLCLFSQTFL